MRNPAISLGLPLLLLAAPCHAAYVLVNGNFEDTSGTFPTGWTTGGTITDPAGAGFANGNVDAFLDPGESITQDFSGGPAIPTAENFLFELDFAFRTSSLSTSTDQRIRLRDNNNNGDIITLGFETAATGGGTALSYFNGSGWSTAFDTAIATGTTYYFRVNGFNLGQPGRYYTIGMSTDGINYSSTGNITAFHDNSAGALAFDFETLRFESGTSQMRIDGVSVIPEPAFSLLGSLGLLALLRRRR